jgi:hypothetical protein
VELFLLVLVLKEGRNPPTQHSTRISSPVDAAREGTYRGSYRRLQNDIVARPVKEIKVNALVHRGNSVARLALRVVGNHSDIRPHR